MKTPRKLTATVLALALTASSALAGDRTLSTLCELEESTDILIAQLKVEYRTRHLDTCGHSVTGRLFHALEEVEEWVDTLHYRREHNRPYHAQVEAYGAAEDAMRKAKALIVHVPLCRPIRARVTSIDKGLCGLGHSFGHHHHADLAIQKPDGPYRSADPAAGIPVPYPAGYSAPRPEPVSYPGYHLDPNGQPVQADGTPLPVRRPQPVITRSEYVQLPSGREQLDISHQLEMAHRQRQHFQQRQSAHGHSNRAY